MDNREELHKAIKSNCPICGHLNDELIKENAQLKADLEKVQQIIDEIKGIVGYPGEEALKKHGLTDTLPNIVRYLHREWLEQTHKAGQRCIEKDIEIDKLQQEKAEQVDELQAITEDMLKLSTEDISVECVNKLTELRYKILRLINKA